MPSEAQASLLAPAGWKAALDLQFSARGERTVLSRRHHVGPLGVQRAFYPEPDGTCHVYILHPPGGLVGGDELRLRVEVTSGARVLLTTPAATKFYRSQGPVAQQHQQFAVAAGARLEWLPQESIVHDGAKVAIDTKVELDADAEFLGWEILCLGRTAMAERFVRGALTQRIGIFRQGRPLLLERARYAGDCAGMSQAFGLRGQPVVGSLLCVTRTDTAAIMPRLREVLDAAAGKEAACSELAGALVCRFVGSKVERAQAAFRAAWGVLRQHCWGAPAVAPRIWQT